MKWCVVRGLQVVEIDQRTARLELLAESSIVVEVAYLMAWVAMERQTELVPS